MVANVPYNPYGSLNAGGTFGYTTMGEVQGTFYDDPAVRYALAGGILADTETLPMWGGVGIYEVVPTASATVPNKALGTIVGRATSLTQTSAGGLSGFSVFNQAHHMVITGTSPVPLAGSKMSVHYFRLGSGARIAVKADPSLVSLQGGVVGQQVSWDFNNQVLQAYDASTPTITINTYTWANTNGGRATIVTAAPSTVGAVGDVVNISGATNAGTGGATAVNGNFIVDTFTDASHFTVAMPAAAGVITSPMGGSPVLNQGTGALPVRILSVTNGNSMTVSYNSVTGLATWNYAGTTAVIQI